MADVVDRASADRASASPGGAAPSEVVLNLVEFWSVHLPARLDRWSPRLAAAFADGAWTALWLPVAAYAPIAAFAVGFLAPFAWPGIGDVYSESVFFMAFAIAVAFLSGSAAAMLLVGYILADLISALSGPWPFAYTFLGPLEELVRLLGGRVISWVLLGVLLVEIPLRAREMASDAAARLRVSSGRRAAAGGLINALTAGVFVFLWCQATVLLIGPLFTWANRSATQPAIYPLQFEWPWLIGAAVVAIAARLFARLLMRWSDEQRQVLDTLDWMLWSRARPAELGDRLPVAARVVARTIFLTLLLSGAYLGVLDAVVVAAVVLLLGLWSAGVIGGQGELLHRVQRTPAVARFLLGILASFALAFLIVASLGQIHESVRLVLLGAVLTIAVFSVLFPARGVLRTASAGIRA